MKIADIAVQDNSFFISGDLNFANVRSVYNKSLSLLNHSLALDFNFSQLKSSDSSGLALMLEWIKLAKKNHQAIRFVSVSPDLLSIAKAAGMLDLISSDNDKKS